jgi:hypothetical protein
VQGLNFLKAASAAAMLVMLPGAAQPVPEAPVDVLTPWERMRVEPGEEMSVRPQPPAEGRKTCVRIDGVAGAQLFGDAGIELTMKNGTHWRMFFVQECPALSFYQGFYYRRGKANMLCAGRDVVGARSGGECRIASIIQVRIVRGAPKRK